MTYKLKDVSKSLTAKGYCQLNNVITEKQSLKLLLEFIKACRAIAPESFSTLTVNSWESEQLSSALIALRKNTPKKFSLIYDLMLKSSAISAFCVESNLISIAQNMLRGKDQQLQMHGLMLRMDVPFDERNLYGWHQDSCYDEFNAEPRNGCVLWIPLVDVDRDNGGLIVMPGSHVEGNVCENRSTGDVLSSRQLIVPDRYLKKYEPKSIESPALGCIASYSNLFHKSGRNVSKKVRFTCIVRFNQCEKS